MSRFSGLTKWRFPIVFGSILAGFTTAFMFRQKFMPETEELHRKHQQEDTENMDEMIAHKTRVNEQRAHIIEEKRKSKDGIKS